jgi:hypothetical protein
MPVESIPLLFLLFGTIMNIVLLIPLGQAPVSWKRKDGLLPLPQFEQTKLVKTNVSDPFDWTE